jgi:hypothetical protein
MKRSAILLIAATLLSPFTSLSQWTDYGVWTSMSVNQKVAKKTFVNLDAALRWDRDATRLGSTFLNADLSRNLMDFLEVTASVRVGASRTDEYLWEPQRRVAVIARLKTDLGEDLSFSFRAQYQTGHKGFPSPNIDFSRAARTKATLNYKLSKDWRLSLSGETFFRHDYLTHYWSDTRLRISARHKV